MRCFNTGITIFYPVKIVDLELIYSLSVSNQFMNPLKQKFFDKSSALRTEIRAYLKEKGSTKVDEVTLSQVFGGMRGVKSMIWETSKLDPVDGIRFRGYSIPELREKLPKRKGDKEPLPEGLFWLMLVDEIPTQEEVDWLSDEWEKRNNIPQHTYDMLDSFPETVSYTHLTLPTICSV